MSQLGDFLEAVYGPTERFNTVRASMHQWRETRTALVVATEKNVIGRRKPRGLSTESIVEGHFAVWMAAHDRLRMEKVRHRAGRAETILTVVNGEKSWVRDRRGEVVFAEGDRRRAPGRIDVDKHFDRHQLRQFFVGLAVEGLGTTVTAGRPCVRIRAVRRPIGLIWSHWLPSGADEYEFHADAAHGVLLSIIARHGGKTFETSEVTEIAFDEPVDDSLFTYNPAVYEQVRAPQPVVEQLTLEAAARRMPFIVLMPTKLPDPDHNQVTVMYYPARENSPRPHHLSLMYRGGKGCDSLWIDEAERVDPELPEFEWETVIRDGREMQISDPGGRGRRIVSLVQDGTYVTIRSDLSVEQLLDLAASLVPVAKG